MFVLFYVSLQWVLSRGSATCEDTMMRERGRWIMWETALHSVCFCLKHVRASSVRGQTLTKNKNTRREEERIKQQTWQVRENNEGQRSSESQLPFCCGQEYVTAVLNKCTEGSGVARWGRSVTRTEGGPADKSLGGSAELASPAQGVTAEYTWPGSFRPSRDNCERLLPKPQPKLTEGIMCSCWSPHSKVDSLNVWLHYHAAASMCVFMCVWGVAGWGRSTNYCLLFQPLCLSHQVKGRAR